MHSQSSMVAGSATSIIEIDARNFARIYIDTMNREQLEYLLRYSSELMIN